MISGTLEVIYANNTIVIQDSDTGDISTVDINTRTYDGLLPGPTLRLGQGERIDITLANNLPENPDAGEVIDDHNLPHHINSTNFHTHGLHVEPTGDADNVIREIFPQTIAAVTIDIPANHNPGTFWYHGHKHGANLVQFYSGMTGFLIIEGDVDEVPEIAAAEERLMMIQEIGIDENGEVPDPNISAMMPGDIFEFDQTFIAINGTVNPTLRMAPGEVQRWRIGNGTVEQFLDLSLEGHQLHQIAVDGVTFGAVETIDSYEMAPGNRIDVLVQAGAPGTYQLSAPGMGPAGDTVLATVVVEGEEVQMDLPTDLPAPDYILPDTSGQVPDDNRAITFAVGPEGFTIDGESFRPDCTNHLLQRGDLVEWVISNSGMGTHPFHIHTNAFQVMEVDGVALDPPVWQDVVGIPGNGSVRVRQRIDDFVGGIVLHCHIILHEDLGMMQNVVLVDDTIPLEDQTTDPGVDPDDPSVANPNTPGYYVSTNFTLCE